MAYWIAKYEIDYCLDFDNPKNNNSSAFMKAHKEMIECQKNEINLSIENI